MRANINIDQSTPRYIYALVWRDSVSARDITAYAPASTHDDRRDGGTQKLVYFLTTITPKLVTINRAHKVNGRWASDLKTVNAPTTVLQYNKHMGKHSSHICRLFI